MTTKNVDELMIDPVIDTGKFRKEVTDILRALWTEAQEQKREREQRAKAKEGIYRGVMQIVSALFPGRK
jgi:hypothetical protein